MRLLKAATSSGVHELRNCQEIDLSTCRVEGFVWKVGTLQKKGYLAIPGQEAFRQPLSSAAAGGVAAWNNLHQGRKWDSRVLAGAAAGPRVCALSVVPI